MSITAGSATPETERKAAEDRALDERIRRIVREEIDKDLLRRSGLTGDAAIAYAAALHADRFRTSNPSEDRHA